MWTELTGMKIDQIVLFISTKPGFSQVFVRKPEEFEEKLTERINQFHLINNEFKCKHNVPLSDECTACLCDTDLLLDQKTTRRKNIV